MRFKPFLQFARAFVNGLPDSRMDVTAIVESGNRVVVEGVFSGTHTAQLGLLPEPTAAH